LNMKILKEGKKFKPITFVCGFCKTEFEAEIGEYYPKASSLHIYLICECPNCKFEVQNEIARCGKKIGDVLDNLFE